MVGIMGIVWNSENRAIKGASYIRLDVDGDATQSLESSLVSCRFQVCYAGITRI
jgi:hypothetical protein